MNSSVHEELISTHKKYILILGGGPTKGLDDTTMTAEKKYSINFTKPNKELKLAS